MMFAVRFFDQFSSAKLILGQVLLDVCMVFVCLLGLNSWVNR